MRQCLGLWLVVLLAGCAERLAEPPPPAPIEAGLQALATTVAGLRADAGKSTPDGKARLILARHQLRDWVILQLGALKQQDDPTPLIARLNQALEQAGMFKDEAACSDREQDLSKAAWDVPCGTLLPITLGQTNIARALALHTGFATLCSSTDSAYVFRWQAPGWRLLFQSEENPAPIWSMRVAGRFSLETEPWQPPLVLVQGAGLGCEGSWGEVTYGLWRTDPDRIEPPPLLERKVDAWVLGEGVETRLTEDELLVEFRVRSVDAGQHNRAFEAHYHFAPDASGRDRVARIAPVALNPRDFVDEWLTEPWTEAGNWVDRESATRLHSWHDTLHKDFVSGEFDQDAQRRCRGDSTLWQVGLQTDLSTDQPGPSLRFLVRWLPPYRFTLVRISDRARPDCTVIDPMLDVPDTLFNDARD